MTAKSQLIEAILTLFKLDGDNPFIYGMIDDAVSMLNPTQYPQFLKSLYGDEFKMTRAADVIEIVSKRFNAKNELPLIEERKNVSMVLFDSLLIKSNAMINLAHSNRNVFPTDWDFFGFCDLQKVKGHDNNRLFDDKELFIIKKLGREWLMNMSNRSQPELLLQIEKVIREAQSDKALPKNERKILEMVK